MELTPDEGGYDYAVLERELSPAVAWLLINALCHADMLEYGTSPRFAWLTPLGRALKAYLATKSMADLAQAIDDGDETICYRDHCNCEEPFCHNPFWTEPDHRTSNR